MLQFADQLWMCAFAGCPWKPSIKGSVQHLIQVCGSDKVQVGSDVGRKLFKVLLVAFGEDDALHSCPMGCQDLVLYSPHLWGTANPGVKTTLALFIIMCLDRYNSPATPAP